MKLGTHTHSSCEQALLKRFSRSEVKGQGHDQTECYNGEGSLVFIFTVRSYFPLLLAIFAELIHVARRLLIHHQHGLTASAGVRHGLQMLAIEMSASSSGANEFASYTVA